MWLDRLEWPARRLNWLDFLWVMFSIANLAGMLMFPSWETVPFHFIWVSLTIVYGFRVWSFRPTMWTLALVMAATATFILIDVMHQQQPLDEITEVPLMAAMFLAMVWHARRRLAATRQMQETYEANARLMDRERRFIQDASHELRTPITVALGHAELIQKATDDPLVKDDARVVVDELMRLRRLADRLLVLAASEHPDFLHKTDVEVESTLVEAMRRWTPVQRRWILGELHEATVSADPDRLALALDALIENAVKHTEPEDPITVSVRRQDGMVVIAVADTGPGIPPQDLGRMFDRFARSDAGRSRNGGGMGLGLAIVKAVAEAHGGSVSVRSSPGTGSTFEVSLPAATPATDPSVTGEAEVRALEPLEPGS